MGRRDKEFRVFVSNLSRGVTTEDIREHFEPCGNILSIRKPGSNPFAFIVFGDYESGQKAIREMHDTELGGEIISVKWSHTSIEAKAFEEEDAKAERERDDEEEPFSTIFVRNVDSLARLSDLRSFGSRVGPVKDCELVDRGKNRTRNAYVTFINEKDAKRALIALNGAFLLGARVGLEKAHYQVRHRSPGSRPGIDEDDICTIFVGNIPQSATQRVLFQIFSKYGELDRCDIIKNRGGLTKGFAFLDYINPQDGRNLLKERPAIIVDGNQLSLESSREQLRNRAGRASKSRRSSPSPNRVIRFRNDRSRSPETTRERGRPRSRSPPNRIVRGRSRSRSRSLSPPRREYSTKSADSSEQQNLPAYRNLLPESSSQHSFTSSGPGSMASNPAAAALLMNPMYNLMMQYTMPGLQGTVATGGLPNVLAPNQPNASASISNILMNPQMMAALQQQQLQLQQLLLAQQQQQFNSGIRAMPPFSASGASPNDHSSVSSPPPPPSSQYPFQ